jgi:signal transduction histidine kinase
MVQRIKYIQYLMIFCILGVILTQGYWLYKDYNYYRGQPLFSSDYDFFFKTSGTAPGPPRIMHQHFSTPPPPGLPTIVAYPSKQTAIAVPAPKGGRMIIKGEAGRMSISAGTMMIGPSTASVYKAVNYKAPLSYVLQKMQLQFGVSILLILFTTTCFIFMSVTIFKQRKLSLAKSDFINNMTHELKTPLATVSVAVEAMRNFGAWDDQHKARLYLNISRNELDHLSKLIELILQQSIFESHKMEISAEYTHVNGMIRKVIQNYALSNEQVDIVQNYADHIPLVPVDPVHMSNVLRNLIDNAIKYSNAQKKISISSRFKNNSWVLTVRDNGIGIPKMYHKDIFERFFRVPRGEVNPVKGFGLGLSYIKQVVGLHNGTIALQSSENEGSIFTISIPVKKTAVI